MVCLEENAKRVIILVLCRIEAEKEKVMIMFNIAGWIANLLVLGIAFVMWAIGIFIVAMLVSMCKQWIDNLIKGESK